MFTSILQLAQGTRARATEITAPGWLPADRVLRTAVSHLQDGHPSSSVHGLDSVRAGESRPPQNSPASAESSLPWAEHCRRRPVTTLADGLSLLTRAAAPAVGAAVLTAEAGPESGFAVEVPRGEWRVGRGDGHNLCLADPYLSRSGMPLVNGPRGVAVGAAGELRAGATRFAAEPREPSPPPTGAGLGETDGSLLLDWPERAEVAPARPPSWALFAAPVAIGLLLVLVTRMWWFALFSLAGPLSALISSRLERRREERENREADAALTRDCLRAAEQLARTLVAFRDRARAAPVGTACVLGRGTVLSPVGVRLPSSVAAADAAASQLPPHTRIGRTAFLHCADAPLVVPQNTEFTAEGTEAQVRGVVRALLTELSGTGAACAPVSGMPETAGLSARTPAGASHDRLAHRADDGPTVLTALTPIAAGRLSAHVRSTGPQPLDTDPPELTVQILSTGETGEARLRVPSPAHLQQIYRARPGQAGASLWGSCGAPLSGPFAVHSHSAATHIRLQLCSPGARTETGPIQPGAGRRGSGTGAGIGPTATTEDVLLLDRTLRSEGGPGAPAPGGLLPVPLGTSFASDGTAGLVFADFLLHGPHALVAGTTGSGKSVLLQAWVELLCRLHTPEELSLVLLDFKGGAGLQRFAHSPHTDALVTDLDEQAALRAIRSISAEVRRREERLAAAGAHDITDYCIRRADGGLPPMPRLLIVIDEFHVLAGMGGSVLGHVERLTALGRSLGIHLLLSTQRPAGVVTAQMRANIALRICLRVRDEAESREVLGLPDAAALKSAEPGAALLSDGGGLQAFRSSAPGPLSPSRITLRSLDDGATTHIAVHAPTATHPEPAHAPAGWAAGPAHRVIAPALPDRIPPAQHGCARAPAALVDLPDSNRVDQWHLDAGTGTVLVSGGRGRGWTTVSRTLAQSARSAGDAVVLLSAADRPGDVGGDVGPWIDSTEILHIGLSQAWAFEFLLAELETRPLSCRFVVDDWEEFQRAQEGSQRVDRLERLLTGGRGVTAVLTGTRRMLTQRVGQSAATRVVFPPHSEQDAVYFGLSAQRFAGRTWPPGRAVVLGAAAPEAGATGAEAQFSLPAPSTPCSASAAHPLWSGFRMRAEHSTDHPASTPADLSPAERDTPARPRSAAPARAEPDSGVSVGTDPRGRIVGWDFERDGRVLVIRAARSHAGAADLLAHLDRNGIRAVTGDTGPQERLLLEQAAEGGPPLCLLLTQTRSGRPGPFDRGNHHGPTLLVGEWQESALRAVGLRDLPLIPDQARASWWIGSARSVPIRFAEAV